MQKITDRKDELAKKTDEKTKKLFENVVRHQLNKEIVLEKLEDKVSPEVLEKFQEFRKQLEQKNGNILETIQNNPNLSQEVKDKIAEVMLQVQNTQKVREDFRAEQKDILEAIKTGREGAKEEFEKLREAKKQDAEILREKYKDEKDLIIEKTLKKQLKDSAELEREKLEQNREDAKQLLEKERERIKQEGEN
jgi:hypothetical protein